MDIIAGPLVGGRGIGVLLRILFHLAVWHVVFHAMRGFLSGYTHIPWLGTVIVAILVVALIRFAMYRRRRRL